MLVTAACVPMPRVPLQATPGALEILAGEWAGEYESAALGRRGSIEFTLKAGTDDAHGEVLMVPRGTQGPLPATAILRGAGPALTCRHPSSSRSDSSARRTVRFTACWIGTGIPIGIASPSSTFDGRLEADVVEGTFKTTSACGAGDASGTWKATKKRAKPNQARR